MPAPKRMRGNPKGWADSRVNKPWTDALDKALAQYAKGKVEAGQALRKIADGVVERAMLGDRDAVNEIAVRLDGKPVQPVAVEADTTLTINLIRFGDSKPSK